VRAVGHPVLELCNTRLGERESWASPAGLADWLLAAGLADERLGVSEADLAEAIALRESLRSILLTPGAPGLAEIAERWLDDAPGRLCVERRTLETRFAPGAGSVRCALVPVVLDALELARRHPGRVRECAGARCTTVFLDLSRNRSRRWCSMARCGARAKASAYYQRHHP
jgi:predicted RNA-binding Zn ribbon-like protein